MVEALTSNPSASLAILPMTVLSPIVTTIPVAEPSTAFVEEKAKFSVSRGLALVQAVSEENKIFDNFYFGL